MQLLAVGLVDAGLLLALLGGSSILRPLSFLGIRTRARGLAVLLAGVLFVVAGLSLPAPEIRVEHPATHLDSMMPVYQFQEVHRAVVPAPRESVYAAIQRVRASEVLFFREAIWIRRASRRGTATTLAALPRMPLLYLLSRVGFMTLADDPGSEIVIGAIVRAPAGWRPPDSATPEDLAALEDPGFVKATMNFRLADAPGGGCLLTTETRVRATDPKMCAAFARYWRLIYPGSAMVRSSWLGAIAREAAGS